MMSSQNQETLGQNKLSAGTIVIELAEVVDLEALSELFDQYRVFYGEASNKPACNHFLFERLINHESVIYLAKEKKGDLEEDKLAVGFAQLYPSFSSVSLLPVWILNDLYVAPASRQQGVGKALIAHCQQLVSERQDKGLVLETAMDNTPAQKLYATCGFKLDNQFQRYGWDTI